MSKEKNIELALAKLRIAFEEGLQNVSSDAVAEKTILDPDFGNLMLDRFCKHAEELSGTRVIHIQSEGNFRLGNFRAEIDRGVLDAIPKPTSTGSVRLVLIKLTDDLTDDELEVKFSELGLQPAHPFHINTMNNGGFCLPRYPNRTHWRNAQGLWCRITYSHPDSEYHGPRRMFLGHSDKPHSKGWWIVGSSNSN